MTAHRKDLGDHGHAKELAERYPDDVEAKILYAFTVSGWRATRRTPRRTTLLGFAYRNLGWAFDHYYEALRLNPEHRGAHEYWLKLDFVHRAERKFGLRVIHVVAEASATTRR